MKPSHQFYRFCLAGVVGLAVDLIVLHAVAPSSNWYIARVVSFWSAATTTWILNRKFTFLSDAYRNSQSNKIWSIIREYGNYLLAMLLGGSLNYFAYAIIVSYFHTPYVATLGVMTGSLIGLMANFCLSRWFVFSKK